MLLAVALWVSPSSEAEQVNSQIGSASNSGTSLTCVLGGVGAYDTVYVGITSTAAVSSVADSASDTYTSRVSAGGATSGPTEGGLAYLYDATPTSRQPTLTVTVTFGTGAFGSVMCWDVAGFGAVPAHTTSGTGTMAGNGTSGITTSVTAYTPTAGNFQIAVSAASVCQSVSSASPPFVNSPSTAGPYTAGSKGGTLKGNGGTADLTCNEGNGHTFATVGYAAWNLTATAPLPSQTVHFSYTGTDSILSCHRSGCSVAPAATWAEVAADFPANVVVTKNVADTVNLAVSNALRNPSNTETVGLTAVKQLAQQINSEGVGLFAKYALAQQVNTEANCLGIQVTVNSVQTVNTGPVCGAPVVQGLTLVVACNFYQFQCWFYPLTFMGMYEAFFIGAALAFRFSEKGFLYFVLAGATFASLIEIPMGIMTPALPILLIVMNVAYSFRLDRLVLGAINR